MIKALEKRYLHQTFEDRVYRNWEKSGFFSPKRAKKKSSFTIIMPPPNANGSLHIGHAMFVTLEDIIARYQRMQGKAVLWLPGADHAGILTQVVFEKKLAKEGKTRFDLGRERFFKQCFKFSQENKKRMYAQLKKLGASCDWTREKFTLDEDVSRQVNQTFIKLYKDGLIYRGERMINWCPRCMTALSDLEVEHHEVEGLLYFIKYPLLLHSRITGDERFIMVATTRPETMFGDTAVAVNPDDKRYCQFIGQKISLPLTNREVPIIADSQVDQEFGTGAVKVTPAHDPVDFEVAKRHRLPCIQVIGFDSKMTFAAGNFSGTGVATAREEVVKALQKQDLLITTKRYKYQVGHCERCQTIIEPQVSLQWFIKIKPMAEIAIQVVKEKKIRIIPRRFEKNYLNWMAHLRDWCVSRQIWWGHRIPVYYCGQGALSPLQLTMNPFLTSKSGAGCGHHIVDLKEPKSCPFCGKKNTIIQDPDTFDTWFSSGQWAYTSLGYPNHPDFKYFYPTSVMETGYEILPIWVAKMIMLSLYRTGKVPFKTVYLHGLVRDAFGEKMSKSRGNVTNPLDVVAKFSADALRMALIVGASPGNDISLGEPKIKGYRNFTNKIWNISRFILSYLPAKPESIPSYSKNLKGLTGEDKAIIKKLNKLIKATSENLDDYKFSPAGENLYHFIWHVFADKYLEKVKSRILNNDRIALTVLKHILTNSLKLLHPFMPFVTEVIWEKIPKKSKKPLLISSWPQLPS